MTQFNITELSSCAGNNQQKLKGAWPQMWIFVYPASRGPSAGFICIIVNLNRVFTDIHDNTHKGRKDILRSWPWVLCWILCAIAFKDTQAFAPRAYHLDFTCPQLLVRLHQGQERPVEEKGAVVLLFLCEKTPNNMTAHFSGAVGAHDTWQYITDRSEFMTWGLEVLTWTASQKLIPPLACPKIRHNIQIFVLFKPIGLCGSINTQNMSEGSENFFVLLWYHRD